MLTRKLQVCLSVFFCLFVFIMKIVVIVLKIGTQTFQLYAILNVRTKTLKSRVVVIPFHTVIPVTFRLTLWRLIFLNRILSTGVFKC